MASFNSDNSIELNHTISDGISNVTFGPSMQTKFLLASSWDSGVYLHDVCANKSIHSYTHKAPVLDCCFSDEVRAYSGGLDKTLKTIDFNSQKDECIGVHEAPIKCVNYCNELNCLITGSWDKTIKVWDMRQSKEVGTYLQHEKVYSMDLAGEILVVATANKNILIWDLRNMGSTQQRRVSNLKYQIRCLRCFATKKGFVMGSIEGRVAVDFLDSDIVLRERYAFKCHRAKVSGIEYIYPVHSIAFNQQHNTFASGGGDKLVNIWDGFNKKRLCQFNPYPSDISSLSFHPDGTQIAIASSTALPEEGKEYPRDTIFIRKVLEVEAKPKKQAQKETAWTT